MASISLALSACSTPSTGGDGGSSDNATKQFVVLENMELGNYNPLLGHGRNGESHIYDSLYRVSPGKNSKPKPVLADGEATSNDDLTEWTVPLKKDISFSDGSSFGPEDVVATYKAIIDPRFASTEATAVESIDDVTPDGDHAVKFHLKHRDSEFDRRIYRAIAPSEAFDFTNPVKAEDMKINSDPIGTGPYKVTSLRPDEAILEARDGYWSDAPETKKIVIRHNTDDNTRAQQMRVGEGDGTMLEAKLADTVAKAKDISAEHIESLDWRGISLPAAHPVAGDDAIRMAVNLGVDRQKMIDDIYAGHGTPTSTFITDSYGDAYDKDSEIPHDTKKAEKILDEAGWVKGSDGIRVKDGQRAEMDVIYFPNRDAARKDLTLAAASDLKAIGIQINPVAKDSSAVTEEVYNSTPVMLGGGGEPYTIDGQIYHILHSKYAADGVGAKWDNASDYVNPEIDKLLDQARSESNKDKRNKLYKKVQQEYRKKPAMLALTYGAHSYVLNNHGMKTGDQIVEPHSHGSLFGPWYNIEEWHN